MQRDVPASGAQRAGEQAAGPRGEGVCAAAASWCSSSKGATAVAAAATVAAAAEARRRRERERRRQPPVGEGVPLAALGAAALVGALLADHVEDTADHVADGELCYSMFEFSEEEVEVEKKERTN